MMRFRRLFSMGKRKKNRLHRQTFYFIFPSYARKLCLSVVEHIKSKFPIQYTTVEYSTFDKKALKDIENKLREDCVLVIFYGEKLTLENCYKLGIAFAHRKQVVLVSLCSNGANDGKVSNKYSKGIPEYVRYQFWVLYTEDQTSQFVARIDNIVDIILSGNTIRALYQKSIDICESIERENKCHIEKVNWHTFERKLQRVENDLLESLSVLYIDDDEDLHTSLLYLIVKNYEDVMTLLRSFEKTRKVSEDFTKIENNYNYISGDQIVGNKEVNNNLQGANVANFANEVKDNAR